MHHNKAIHKNSKISLLTLISLCLIGFNTYASELIIPNVFTANQPAVAADVNANFTATKTSVDDNNNRLENLEAAVTSMLSTIIDQQNTITQLQADLSAVENNTVLELDGLLQYALIDGYDTAEFTNVNVQINNGTGDTDEIVNGKGNLIIGYNEISSLEPFFCSDPQYTDSVNCIGNLEIWAKNVRTGSHNLILGQNNSFAQYSSLIAGRYNVSNGIRANVLGGSYNISTGTESSISGGSNNNASGALSNISGGSFNTSSGFYSSISGGYLNNATDFFSNVSGGRENTASGQYSNISGGRMNIANGNYSIVSGGFNRDALGTDDWVAGTLFETN